MNYYVILIIILFAISIGFNIYANKKRDKLVEKLSYLLADGKYDEYYALLKTKDVEKQFPLFNRKYMILSAAMMEGNHAKIKNAYLDLLDEKMSEKQKMDVYIKGFNYFLSMEDEEMIHRFYKLTQTLKDENAKKDIDLIYDIMVLKGSKYLDELLAKQDTLDVQLKGYNAVLISLIYTNLNDAENAQKYKDLSEFYLTQKEN